MMGARTVAVKAGARAGGAEPMAGRRTPAVKGPTGKIRQTYGA